jgi:hypothetical protein
MRKHGVYTLCIGLIISGLTGCSMDRTAVIEHPTTAQPNAALTISLADMYVFYDTAKTIHSTVVRDSVHFAAGLPAGWSIQSITYYVGRNLKLASYIDTAIDTAGLAAAFAESLIVYKARATAMTADAGMADFLKHKAFKAELYSSSSDTATIRTDSVAQWLAYSDKCDVTLAAGSKPDKLMKNPDTSTAGMVDSIAITAVPVFIYATLKAGPYAGDFKLYYYTKTSRLVDPATLTNSMSTAYYDKGDMVWVPITLSLISSAGSPFGSSSAAAFSVSPSSLRQGAIAHITLPSNSGYSLGVYSTDGRLIRQWKGGPASGEMQWNATDMNGRPVNAGMYLFRLQANGATTTKSVRYIK